MALHLERIVRPYDVTGVVREHRVITPLASGSFDGVTLDEACRRCRDDARHFPEDRRWVLRVIVPG